MSDRFSRALRTRALRTWGLVAALTLLLVPVAPAGAQGAVTVSISTVPRLEGIAFSIGGRRAVTGADGTVAITLPQAGVYELESYARQTLEPDVRVAFAGWSDGQAETSRSLEVTDTTAIDAGFDVDYLIHENYVDARGRVIPADELRSVTVTDGSGRRFTWAAPSPGVAGPTAVVWERYPPGTRWVRATEVALTDGDLVSRDQTYELQAVNVGGELLPASTQSLPVQPGAEWTLSPAARPWWSGAWGWAAVLAIVALAIAALVRSRTRFKRPASALPARSAPALNTRRDGEYVRVALRNGRTVEGWRMTSNDAGKQAIIVEVSAVYSAGEQVPSTPLDSFLLTSQIVSYETVDAPSPASPPHASSKRLNPPVSS
jgi:Family of unknown function (DUF6338)